MRLEAWKGIFRIAPTVKNNIIKRALWEEKGPEYANVKLISHAKDREETAGEKKKREANNDKTGDKTNKRDEWLKVD